MSATLKQNKREKNIKMKYIFSVVHYTKNIHVYSVRTGIYTHLVDKFSPLVKDVDFGSSMTTDNFIHEFCNTFSKFPFQWLGFWPLAGVVNGSNYGVKPLISFRQIGDAVNANLSYWHPGNWDGFKLLTTLFKLATTFHTAFYELYCLLSEAWEVYFGLDKGNSFVSTKVTTHSLGFN